MRGISVLLASIVCLYAVTALLPVQAKPQGATLAPQVIATIPVAASGIAVNPYTSRICATNYISDTVSVIDAGTHAVIKTIPVGDAPLGIAVNPVTNKVYVANHNGSAPLSVIDGVTNNVIKNIPVAKNAWGVA